MIANTEKKIVIRKAPVEKANIYETGFIATGSDNEKYIVTEMKNGFKRWTKMKAPEVENVEPEPEVIVAKPKRSYKKKVVEPIVIVEPEPEPEPVVIVEPEPEMVPVKPKRTYKKKVAEPESKKQCCEQETQTDEEEVIMTPTKPKKERKVPDAPKKK
jgi:hypothetical protein